MFRKICMNLVVLLLYNSSIGKNCIASNLHFVVDMMLPFSLSTFVLPTKILPNKANKHTVVAFHFWILNESTSIIRSFFLNNSVYFSHLAYLTDSLNDSLIKAVITLHYICIWLNISSRISRIALHLTYWLKVNGKSKCNTNSK